jgi:hypothetical protein
MSKTCILYSTDWHAGNSNGVLAPGTRLIYNDPGEPYKEYTPNLTGAQDRIWNVTQNCISYAEKKADGSPLITIIGGDIQHGKKFVEMLVSTRGYHQGEIAMQYYDEFPKRLNVTANYMVYGTDAHTDEGTAEVELAEKIRDKYAIESIAVNMLTLNVEGVVLDIAHEGPQSGRSHTLGNPPRIYLRRAMSEDLDTLNKPPADVYLRGHFHSYADESASLERNGKFYHSRIITCPAMCSSNGYARAATRAQSFLRIGMIYMEVENGHLTFVKELLQNFDLRSRASVGVTFYKYIGEKQRANSTT